MNCNNTHDFLLSLNLKNSYFKEIQISDYPKIISWINDPNFNKFLYQGLNHVSNESFSKQVSDEKSLEDAKIFSQFNKLTNQLVGWCGLYFPTSKIYKSVKKAEIRSFVGTEFWGQGYGTEQYVALVTMGFEVFNLNKVFFGTHQDNIGIQKIYQKLNFFKEGISRQDYFRNNFADIYRYSILQNEYHENIKKIFESYLKN
tara:strand:- start:39 stop:641 length:603 start_codon:yes stop_codon:yes gene_type:complete